MITADRTKNIGHPVFGNFALISELFSVSLESKKMNNIFLCMFISINHTQKNNERENKLVPTNHIGIL